MKITEEEAKNAWLTIKSFAMENSSKSAFAQDDVTVKLQKAVMCLDQYFSQGGNA